MDNAGNEDGIGDRELVAVSCGTSCRDNRRITIGAIEQALEDAFGSEYAVRRCFTSRSIIGLIKRREGVAIDYVTDALERAAANGVRTLVLQPTHLLDGLEYSSVVNALAEYAGFFEQAAIGRPLLDSEQDYQAVMAAIMELMEVYDDGETAICFMGHGTKTGANAAYERMQRLLAENGCSNYYIGTVEAAPGLEDVLAKIQEKDYRRVVLRPFMIVAGDHANNCMAGDGEDSWKSRFTAAGYEVICVVEGLGGIPAIRDIFVKHAQAAIDSLKHSDRRREGISDKREVPEADEAVELSDNRILFEGREDIELLTGCEGTLHLSAVAEQADPEV